jgi:hypothetical protein
MPNTNEINISINFEDMSRLRPDDSGLPPSVRTALKDLKRTTELTHDFASTLSVVECRSFLVYAERQGFKHVASELRRELQKLRPERSHG